MNKSSADVNTLFTLTASAIGQIKVFKITARHLAFTMVPQGWRLMKQQDRLRIEIVGEESYAPPTFRQKEGIERRRRWYHLVW